MLDPDGEFAWAPILVVAAKAAAFSAGVSAATYAASTAISGQSWNWGQFAAQVGKGAAIGGLTAGAGSGFAAGLKAVGVGVEASNFIGGALGSFSGTLAGGGMPSSPMEWASVLGSAALSGNALKNTNPLNLKRAGNSFDVGGFENLGILLPTVDYTDMSLGNFPSWWRKTNLIRNDVARAVALQGSYSGAIDAISGFFNGDRVEANWYSNGDGSFSEVWHSQFVGGEGPAIGAGKLASARNSYQKVKYLKELAKSGKSPKWMNQWLKNGKVPPGYQVHHRIPLFRGGADLPTNMKLIDIKMHRAYHRLFGYRPR